MKSSFQMVVLSSILIAILASQWMATAPSFVV